MDRDTGRFDRPEDVLVPSGCAALYRRAMLEEIGTFDEAFFMYCDDVDLGLRGRVAGWRCRYAPDALVRHRYSLSAGKYSLRKVFLVERNRVWVMLKSFPWTLIALSVPWTALRLWWHAYAAWRGRGGAGRAAEKAAKPLPPPDGARPRTSRPVAAGSATSSTPSSSCNCSTAAT